MKVEKLQRILDSREAASHLEVAYKKHEISKP
jgi:hypothetical protein